MGNREKIEELEKILQEVQQQSVKLTGIFQRVTFLMGQGSVLIEELRDGVEDAGEVEGSAGPDQE